MSEVTVYADLTFLVNFVLDLLILWVSARLCAIKLRPKRLIISSLLGGIYGTGIIISPEAWYYSFGVKVLMSAFLVYIGLKPLSIKQLVSGMIYFYLLCFVTAGAVWGLALANEGQTINNIWYLLLAGIILLILLGLGANSYVERKVLPHRLNYKVRLIFSESSSCDGIGFLDTGNGLRDPLNGKPVVIAEYDFLKKCIPPDLQEIIEKSGCEEGILEVVEDCSWKNRLRIIPYSSVGKEAGIMLGIRADRILVNKENREMKKENVVIAICLHKLNHDDSFCMLIPSALIKENGG
ncbi:MAG: sigma-E processing peptidase SpoIIGA [Syntrophomonadaceae bacterium]|jgi:stage II sporulation protein GA (sporulation sigma-E factor processing peptidase)|nr:sigma-E processing peptidase SpoIIGA [Syntrophomonadaceae bacterium]